MAVTTLAEVTNQVQSFWAPIFTKELRQKNILINLLDKSYSGVISSGGGNVVRVSQINAPEGQLLTVGTDADTFDSEALSTSHVDITANKRAVASLEFSDLAEIQSQIQSQESEIRDSLMYAVAKQVNTYLYSILVPSTSAPDHAIVTTDMSASALSGTRLLAAKAKWPTEQPWYATVDPTYYSDILDDTTLASADYGATDRPMIGGQMALPRMGFNIFEDNSLGTDIGYFFYKDVAHLVMQQMPRFKISDLHGQGKFGFKISADMVFGCALGIDGDTKVIKHTGS